MVKYDSFSRNTAAVTELMKQFPPMIQTIFGMNGLDLTTALGYYGAIFLYLIVMTAIYAGMLGSDLLTKEEQDKTSEFLYVKPIKRTTIITQKLLAGLTNIIIFTIMVYLISYFSLRKYVSLESIQSELSLMIVALFIVQLLFFSLGVFLAASIKDYRQPARLTAAIILLSYLAYVVVGLNGSLSWLKYFSPIWYFDARYIIADKTLEPSYVIACLILTTILLFGAYSLYKKRDLTI